MGKACELCQIRFVRITQDRILTDPQLYTLLTEVESILNTRPLTCASEDADDLEGLTPNLILLSRHRNWVYVTESIGDEQKTLAVSSGTQHYLLGALERQVSTYCDKTSHFNSQLT